MLNPIVARDIKNFILIKYTKHRWDSPGHVEKLSLNSWNAHHGMMFTTMLEQLNFFYPHANIHVLTNEHEKNFGKVVWHYRPELAENHSAKLQLYGLLNVPAMYIDNDILIVKPFNRKHLHTKHPFNLFHGSYKRLQQYTQRTLPFELKKQYNCGLIWIARPNPLIVQELIEIKKEYFNNKEWIESSFGWFNNDEHPVAFFITKYDLKMTLFRGVNVFRNNLKYQHIFKQQSIHYTGVKQKKRFVKEYRELCQTRVRIFA